MAVLSLIDDHKKELKFLHKQPTQILADFCKLAWSFLSKGANPKMYQTASQKLQVDVKQIQSGVEALVNLFIEAGKTELSEEEFREAVTELGFSKESCSVIYCEYSSQKNILLLALQQAGVQHPQYKNLDWRFETQVMSKSVRNFIQPRVVMKLDLEKVGETKSICLQSDIPNIIHMNQIISQALLDSRTHHSKKIQKEWLKAKKEEEESWTSESTVL